MDLFSHPGLNRALRQVTGKGYRVKDLEIRGFKCPELYYPPKDSHIPNVSAPLLWTQANLTIVLKMMEQSLMQVS